MEAKLVGFEPKTRMFTYGFDIPIYSAWSQKNHSSCEIYARPGFTKLKIGGMEVSKSLGVETHLEALYNLGYEMYVPNEFVQNLSDDDLLAMLDEFEFVGENTNTLEAELNLR